MLLLSLCTCSIIFLFFASFLSHDLSLHSWCLQTSQIKLKDKFEAMIHIWQNGTFVFLGLGYQSLYSIFPVLPIFFSEKFTISFSLVLSGILNLFNLWKLLAINDLNSRIWTCYFNFQTPETIPLHSDIWRVMLSLETSPHPCFSLSVCQDPVPMASSFLRISV